MNVCKRDIKSKWRNEKFMKEMASVLEFLQEEMDKGVFQSVGNSKKYKNSENSVCMKLKNLI